MQVPLRAKKSRGTQSSEGTHNVVRFTSRSLTRFPEEISEENPSCGGGRKEPFCNKSEHIVLQQDGPSGKAN